MLLRADTVLTGRELLRPGWIDIADGTITSLPIPPGAQISAVSGTERYTFLLYLRTFGEPEPIGVVLKRD